jgi:hypothetical protein
MSREHIRPGLELTDEALDFFHRFRVHYPSDHLSETICALHEVVWIFGALGI